MGGCLVWVVWGTLVVFLGGCAGAPEPARDLGKLRALANHRGTRRMGERLERRGEEIVACGQFFYAATPVTTWLDPGGFNAYAPFRWFAPEKVLPARPAGGCNTPSRLSVGRVLSENGTARIVPSRDWTLEALRKQVRMFVVHYDVAWTSQNCFRVLHDVRGLSVHFLLDLDGRLYQTCDLKERARHAGAVNDVSIGVEIAHPGLLDDRPELQQAYRHDDNGVRLELPARYGKPREPGFVVRPARPEPVTGRVHDRTVVQYDFTDAQYDALARLLACVHRVFPRVRLEAPRGPDGKVLTRVLNRDELARFEGVLGHWHVSRRKLDPGPAFDWDRVLKEARRLVAE